MLFVGGECLLITKDMRQAEYLQVYLREEAGYSGWPSDPNRQENRSAWGARYGEQGAPTSLYIFGKGVDPMSTSWVMSKSNQVFMCKFI